MPTEAPTQTASLEQKPCLVRLPDDSIMAVMDLVQNGEAHVVARRTTDDGETWTAKEVLFDLEPGPGGWGGNQALLDDAGDVHVFLVNDAHTGVIKNVSEGETRQTKLDLGQMHLDVWHTKTRGSMRSWTPPKKLWEGWCGAFNSSIQLTSGRLLLPFGARSDRDWHNRGEGLDAFTYMGSFEIVVLYSDDLGETWQLAPDVIKLPTHTLHNYGTAYPYPVATATNKALVATGQGHAQIVLQVDPDWLADPSERVSYSNGLAEWSTFGTRGVEVRASREGSGREANPVLAIGKSDPGWPAVAVRSIPHATWGFARIELLLQSGFGGARIVLTDHFSPPFDFDDELNGVFVLRVDPDGSTAAGKMLALERWHSLVFRWDLQSGTCVVREGERTMEVLRERRQTTGISYLRFRSPAEGTNCAGFLVGGIRAESLDRTAYLP